MKNYFDIRLADPFLRPNWRHERVLKMLGMVPPERCTRYDDPWIKEYKKFLAQWRKAEYQRERLMHEYPGLYYAYRLHENAYAEPELCLMIQARLLAGYTPKEIAHDCKTIPETIEWYEKLFFNVADFLEHNDWIVKNVLIPSVTNFIVQPEVVDADDRRVPEIVKPYLDMTIKMFSYFGGPLLCDIMINGFKRNNRLENLEDLSNYMNENFMLQLERRSLQAVTKFEINRYNVMELLNMHSNIIAMKKADKNDQTQRNELEKHIYAMMTAFPWAAGLHGAKKYEGTPMGTYDKSAIELNSSELVEVGMGNPVASIEAELKEKSPFENRN